MNGPAESPPPRGGDETFRADPYREWDAAYVLGALSPAERREFEEHLAGCADCRAEVAEVAGMPGLLAQIGPESVTGAVESTGSPGNDGGSVTPTRTAVVDLRQRRLMRAVVGLAAACVLLAGVIGVAAVRGTFSVTSPSADAPLRLAFTPVAPVGITAVVDVVPVAQGTELRVECQYAANGSTASYAGSEYALVVTDRSGRATAVKTWTARTNHVMTPSGTSSLSVADIAAVQIRPANSDQVLLTAPLP